MQKGSIFPKRQKHEINTDLKTHTVDFFLITLKPVLLENNVLLSQSLN